MKCRSLVTLAALLLVGRAFSLATHAIPAADLAKRVPLTRLADFASDVRLSVRTPDFVASRDQDYGMRARGRDKSGKPWVLELSPATHGLWVTTSARTKTYFFAGYTGGAGMAPGAWIVALSFDERRQPVPFCVVGDEEYGNDGIRELVDLDGTGPELIQQQFVESQRLPDSRAGYFVTTLYQQRGVYWYRVDGRHGSKVFPIFERWVMLPGHEPEEVPAPQGSAAMVRNYGNDLRSGGAVRANCRTIGAELN